MGQLSVEEYSGINKTDMATTGNGHIDIVLPFESRRWRSDLHTRTALRAACGRAYCCCHTFHTHLVTHTPVVPHTHTHTHTLHTPLFGHQHARKKMTTHGVGHSILSFSSDKRICGYVLCRPSLVYDVHCILWTTPI